MPRAQVLNMTLQGKEAHHQRGLAIRDLTRCVRAVLEAYVGHACSERRDLNMDMSAETSST